jgi:hypothetical protein
MSSDDKHGAIMILRIRATELRKSGELIWASDVIRFPGKASAYVMGPDAHHVMYRPAMLLFGLALEAYVKALLIHLSPDSLQDAMGGMSRQAGGHDLLALCRQAGISINDREKDALIRLTKSVVWISKYFAPKNSAQPNPSDMGRFDSDYATFRPVYEKVRALLPPPIRPDED